MHHPGAVRAALFILVFALALSAVLMLMAWWYTSSQLVIARSHGTYASAEEGMRAMLAKGYQGIERIDVLYAGPNSFDGSEPHVWYVIAEVRATSRSDGAPLGHDGCDSAGSFFLQTRRGWVHVSEGAFPQVIGVWMRVFGLAGPGQSTPTTDWAPGQPARYCQSA